MPSERRAYKPFVPAKRPGGKPEEAPRWRVLVHRQYLRHYSQLVERVGLQSAERFWDHLATQPDQPGEIGTSSVLKGKAGDPIGDGWSRVIHYELSGKARANYSCNPSYQTADGSDEHHVVYILTLDYSSH